MQVDHPQPRETSPGLPPSVEAGPPLQPVHERPDPILQAAPDPGLAR